MLQAAQKHVNLKVLVPRSSAFGGPCSDVALFAKCFNARLVYATLHAHPCGFAQVYNTCFEVPGDAGLLAST